MKNLTRILLLTLTLSGCAIRPSNINSLPTPPIQSIAMLQHVADDGSLEFYCTTWYFVYPDGIGVWLTNYHCIANADGTPQLTDRWRINGEPARVLAGAPMRDLAMLSGPSAVPLRLTQLQAGFGDAIMTVGFPAGIKSVARGVIANPAHAFTEAGAIFAEYDMSLAGGASGSPVMDNSGRVTGMISYSRCHPMVGFCARSGGPNLVSVQSFLIAVREN